MRWLPDPLILIPLMPALIIALLLLLTVMEKW